VIAAAAVLALPGLAVAGPVDDLMKDGSKAYADGRYDDAIAKMQKAYELSPKPEILFALAQAERLGGHCPAAIHHYKQVLERMTDIETAKLVQGNISLCEHTEGAEDGQARSPQPGPAPTPAPKVIVRVTSHPDALAVASAAGGALALGGALGLYVASNAERDAAAGAPTLGQNRSDNDRADLERGLSYVAAAVGVGLVSYAVVRWVKGGSKSQTEVGLAPTSHGVTFSLARRW
jgi:tetratricopeptide (TPR) repeat protein